MKIAAPLLPMLTEEIYTGLTSEDQSVHQQAWPKAEDLRPDPELVAGMDAVRAAASAALSLREDLGDSRSTTTTKRHGGRRSADFYGPIC